jgi:hypothetical protein
MDHSGYVTDNYKSVFVLLRFPIGSKETLTEFNISLHAVGAWMLVKFR